ncbi:hypothetical protein RQP46_000133 [Phenoliferia psychrophenolica]
MPNTRSSSLAVSLSVPVPTASIHSLAVETLHYILELTVEPYNIRADLADYPDLRGSRAETLQACALVCRDWRQPACALLWRHVDLLRKSGLEAWTESPASGKYTTLSLSLMGDDIGSDGNEITGMQLMFAICDGKLDGLKSLSLRYFRWGDRGIKANFWSMKGLASLQHLKLGHNCPVDPYFAGTSVMRPSFELLTFASEQQEPWLFQILFGASSATLTSLRAEYVIDTRLSSQLYLLRSLESLSIQYLRDPDDVFPSFATLTSLRRFVLNGQLGKLSDEQRALLFNSIEAPLEELVVANLQRVELWNESEFSPDWVTELEATGIEVIIMKSDMTGGPELRRCKPKAG